MEADKDEILKTAINAAKKAGEYLIKEKNNKLSATKKSDSSFVTNADKKAEKIITKIISKKYPSHGILGEEEKPKNDKSEIIWVVDPIDGTHNYMKGLPYYCVSIGVAYKNELIVGVINIPEFKELYHAIKDKGSYLNNKRIKIKNYADIRPNIAFEHGGGEKDNLFIKEFFSDPYFSEFSFRKFGSASYDLSLVAKGSLSVFVSYKPTPYDIAAGILIVREAGGAVTDLNGNDKELVFSKNIIACSSKSIHKDILKNHHKKERAR